MAAEAMKLDAAHGRGGQVLTNQKVDRDQLLACRRFSIVKEYYGPSGPRVDRACRRGCIVKEWGTEGRGGR